MEKYAELLEELRIQRQEFITQKEQIQSNFNQILGAIFALDAMIKKIEEKESSTGESIDEANNTAAQQPAQE